MPNSFSTPAGRRTGEVRELGEPRRCVLIGLVEHSDLALFFGPLDSPGAKRWFRLDHSVGRFLCRILYVSIAGKRIGCTI